MATTMTIKGSQGVGGGWRRGLKSVGATPTTATPSSSSTAPSSSTTNATTTSATSASSSAPASTSKVTVNNNVAASKLDVVNGGGGGRSPIITRKNTVTVVGSGSGVGNSGGSKTSSGGAGSGRKLTIASEKPSEATAAVVVDVGATEVAKSNPKLNSITLSQVLKNPVYKEAYSLYLETKRCSEVLDFYDAVELLKSTAHLFKNESRANNLRTDAWKEMVMDIFTHFICEDSPEQINIPGTTLSSITAKVNSNNFPLDIFDSAQEEMRKMMQSDSFQQFLVTPTFKLLLSTHPLIVSESDITFPEVSALPICPKCEMEIAVESKTCIVKDSLWHAACVSCIHCDAPLSVSDYSQQFPKCSSCNLFDYTVSAMQANDKRMFQDTTPSCLTCDQLIDDEEYIVRTTTERPGERFFWHSRCFMCPYCEPLDVPPTLPFPFESVTKMNFSLSEMTVTCGSHSTCPAVPFHIPKRPRQEILSLRPPLQTPHAPILSLPEMPPRLFSFHSRWPSPPQIVPPLYFPPVPPSPVRATNRRVPLTVIVAPPHMAQNNLPIPICTCVFGNEAKCPCSPLQHLSHKVDSSNPSSPAPMHFRSQSVCPVRVTPTALLSLRHQRRGNTTAPGTIPASHPPRLPVQPPALLVESIPIPPQPCNYNNPKVHAPISPECMRGLNPQPPLIKGTRPPLSIMIRPSKTTMELIPPPSQCENIRPPSSAMTVPLYTLVAPPPTKRFQVQVPENVELPEPKKIQQETVQVHSQELALQPKLHEVVNIKPTKLSAVHVEAVADDGNDDYAQFQASLHSTPKRRSREEKERALAETIPLESQLEVIQQLQQQQQKITQLQRRKSNMYNHLTSEQLKQEAVVQFHQLRKQQEERQRLHQQLLKDNRIRNKILKHKQRRQSSLKELLTDVENLPESVVQQPETGHASTEYVQQREQASFYKMLQSALSAQPPPRPDISAVFTSTNSNSTNSTSPTQPQTPRSQTPPPQVLKPQGYSTATVKAPPTTASASPPSTHLRNSSVVPPGSTNTENCMSCNKPVTASTPHKFIPGLNRRVHNDCILCVTCGIKIPSSFGMTEGKFYCTGCYSRRMQNTVCFVCHEPIPASSFAVNAEGKHCHSKCFCCSLCKAPFGDMSFTKLRDKFLCPSCHTKVITLLQSRQEHRL